MPSQIGSPPQMWHRPLSAFDEVGEFSRCILLPILSSRSPSELTVLPFLFPALQNSLDVAPASFIVFYRALDGFGNPVQRVVLLRVFQMVGDDRRQRANVRFVQAVNIRAFRQDFYGVIFIPWLPRAGLDLRD